MLIKSFGDTLFLIAPSSRLLPAPGLVLAFAHGLWHEGERLQQGVQVSVEIWNSEEVLSCLDPEYHKLF